MTLDIHDDRNMTPLYTTHPGVMAAWASDCQSRGIKVPFACDGERRVAMAYLPGVAWVARFRGHVHDSHRSHVRESAHGRSLPKRLFDTFFLVKDHAS